MSVTSQVTNAIAEEGHVSFSAAFTDEDGASVVPDTITWTLTDESGNVINSRSEVSVSPAAAVDIVLSGDDLSIGNYGTRRVLLIEYTFTSSLGSGLPGKHQVSFKITDLVAVS